MPRSLWKGSLAFGLVNIPVELHTAVRDHRPHFRLLHAKDKAPVKFARVCAKEGKEIAWEDLVKGFEYSKGRFVILTKDDFQAAAVEKTHRVDIIDFVDAEEIDDRYFETPYYVVPGKGGDHAYALLREAMRQEGKVGIAKFILRETQHLAAVEVIEDALVLSTMRFADELVDTKPLDIPARAEVRKAELDMARALINNLAAEWDPEKYTDEYRDNLMKIIEAKAKGKQIELEAEQPERDSNVIDLMERLRQSLDARKGAAPRHAAAPKRGHKKTASLKKRQKRTAA
jgi:DNA end-binding protein Ku